MPFPGCCKAWAGKTAVWREAGGWQEDVMVLRSNCTISGKHTTTIFLWMIWISGMHLGLREASPPCYKQSPTDPWDRCARHCAAAGQQGVMRNGHLNVIPRFPAGGESLVCRSCFCFQREKGKEKKKSSWIFLETCLPKFWESSRSKSEFYLKIQIFQILKLENCKAGKSVKEKICPKMTSRRKINQIFHGKNKT